MNTAAAPRVSVVMPIYNAEATLRRSVESVLAQTHSQSGIARGRRWLA